MSSTESSNSTPTALTHSPGLEPGSICAVVVTYRPDDRILERLQHIRVQVGSAVIVDNGSDEDTFRHVQPAACLPGVTLIRNTANRGQAAALNQGVQKACDQGYAWALLFDQDTVPWTTTVEKLVRAYQEFPDKQHLAVIGCNRFLKSPAAGGSWWTKAKTVITSGSLVSLKAVHVVGNFREDFFIDGVDFEFCLRARSRGFAVVEILEPIMTHSIGNPKPARLLWIKGRTANHQPWRWYYMARNNAVLLSEYLWKEPLWAIRNAWTQCHVLALALLFDDARMQRLKYVTLGLRDALFRRFDRVII